MVGLVIVSHSYEIAKGVKELSMQMIQSDIKIVDAGGMSDREIGTDPNKIRDAILEADTGDGVVVLVDLGSAIMSSEMAIEFLDMDQQGRILIADAPVVEGAIAAAVQASVGGTLQQVKDTAEECRNTSKL
ncbi:dihydroxyacetone kinase phosphoryl donor subunit DhaM [Geosporobacter ferrireducens]|uniref:phosphoenolpyruvate--glycerone phosphotransferase n=1 Tax=Geosporobacter ferrireducens TaxID=1424294 RepID=A0A1D8GHQ6_9FIRM|nr:dihydroxyacetone kinase phosphoryl donor subunit DhaM [Geosporobacter ferrireducens]AOT70434.1 PTS-dependent dihydroxyacetone kinase phosphotransferase subunit DhaM [Geosporobacter ferrireducens]MTI58124.1 PTS-dependent dihydroxyacetone kinase phosphotransferase subunit DhaM [Geosporobacter ferrireducens]